MQWRLWKGRFVKLLSHKPTSTANTTNDGLPPDPRQLIANRLVSEVALLERGRARCARDTDTPLAALYRIYEHIVLDQHIAIRNEIEAFWFHSGWAVRNIPDPRDLHPERYACLACIPALLCLAFNRSIELGLPRDAPPIFTRDMLDEWRGQERRFKQEPPWAEDVPPLATTLGQRETCLCSPREV